MKKYAAISGSEAKGRVMAEIMVIYTGGTIGMVEGPNGLTPSLGLLETAVAQIAGPQITLRLEQFSPLIDSSNIRPQDWNRILDLIEGYEGAGVVVVHGTDTMAYTGAALSTALTPAKLPVVLCGSMVPLGQEGDAEGNLALALDAALTAAPGVLLAFAGKLMSATGLVKHDSHQADSFRTWPQRDFQPRLHRFEARRVAVISLSPGLPVAAIDAMLDHLDAAVLRVYGAGTMMEDDALHQVLRKALARGCLLRAVSQCEAGGLEQGAYAAGQALWAMGVQNGGPETAELALARLWLS